MLHEGEPTRRAKLQYTVRDVGDNLLVDFVDADARVMKQMFKLYNRLHEVEIGLTDDQVQTLILRTECYLRYLLQVRALSRDKNVDATHDSLPSIWTCNP